MSYDIPFNDNGEEAAPPFQNNKGYNNGNYNKTGGSYSKGYYNPNNNSNGGNAGFNNNSGGNNKFYQKGNYQKSNFRRQEEEDVGEPKLYKTYVGTGNKEAPPEVLSLIKRLTRELEEFGFVLRTGGLEGPEEAFEVSAKNMELHLPWRGFNNKESKFTFTPKQALGIAKMFHPTFESLKPAIQTIIAKNVRLVMGKDLKSPTMFVICWSEDGVEKSSDKTSKTGNVGFVVSIACAMHIPVFNLANPDAEKRLKQYLGLPYVENQELKEI